MKGENDCLDGICRGLSGDKDWDGECKLSNGTAAVPYRHIFMQFNSAQSEVDVHTLLISLLKKGSVQQSFGVEKAGDILQLLSLFPYEVAEGSIASVVRLLGLLNKVVPVGFFGYDEQEKRCFYRYSYLLDETISSDSLITMVQLVCEVINTYAPTIEEVSAGIVSVDALLEEFKKTAQ